MEAVVAPAVDAAAVEARVVDAADRGGKCFGSRGEVNSEKGRADALPFSFQVEKKVCLLCRMRLRVEGCFRAALQRDFKNEPASAGGTPSPTFVGLKSTAALG